MSHPVIRSRFSDGLGVLECFVTNCEDCKEEAVVLSYSEGAAAVTIKLSGEMWRRLEKAVIESREKLVELAIEKGES